MGKVISVLLSMRKSSVLLAVVSRPRLVKSTKIWCKRIRFFIKLDNNSPELFITSAKSESLPGMDSSAKLIRYLADTE